MDKQRKDWSKDNEVLKVSHAHNAEWMQKMQRDVMDMKDEVREMKNEHALYTKELREEAAHLRVQWDQQVDRCCSRKGAVLPNLVTT